MISSGISLSIKYIDISIHIFPSRTFQVIDMLHAHFIFHNFLFLNFAKDNNYLFKLYHSY